METLTRKMPTGASLFSTYASLSATFAILKQAFNQFVPVIVQNYIYDLLLKLFNPKSPYSPNLCNILIPEKGYDSYSRNEIFDACQTYLCDRMSDSANTLKVCKVRNEGDMTVNLASGVRFSDSYEGIDFEWSFEVFESSNNNAASGSSNKQSTSQFILSFNKEYKSKILKFYIPFVVEASKEIALGDRGTRIHACEGRYSSSDSGVALKHPFTFEKLAMDPEEKTKIVDDLDRFLRRREFYRSVGKPWKRGYLLYGPPGTGKSSLIAAMANYLTFDIYDLQLNRHIDDSYLRQLLITIPSRSIIVIEDIDCTGGLPSRPNEQYNEKSTSLSALLNFVDGLWSCCGDERVIVFTTNHKERLDPALLRPGRMDMHIHMSYLTFAGFQVLARNYHKVTEHSLFNEIETLLETTQASPAEVAEELMRSEDADTVMVGVVELLKAKKSAQDAKALKSESNCIEKENTEVVNDPSVPVDELSPLDTGAVGVVEEIHNV